MTRAVAVGLDGSPESLAAADWAARESLMSDLPLRLLHIGEQQPHGYVPFAGEPPATAPADHSAALLRETAVRLHHRHPCLRADADQLPGQPVAVLVGAARRAAAPVAVVPHV
ncbi:universal stress protein [Streptomyces sp. NPDC086777]|uniref:universal stress protein n=1 Tax=Streptomyces sp. NPDC086777 TaxID=3154866 RepID=UPI00344D3407